jgi:hypothetical protein
MSFTAIFPSIGYGRVLEPDTNLNLIALGPLQSLYLVCNQNVPEDMSVSHNTPFVTHNNKTSYHVYEPATNKA